MRLLIKIVAGVTVLVGASIDVAGTARAQGVWNQFLGGPYTSSRRLPDGMRRAEPRPYRGAVESRNRVSAAKLAPERVVAAAPVAPPLLAVVSLKSQSLTIWGENGQVLQSRISSGQPGYNTPAGVFSVIQKNRYHESNIYSGAPMPFMQRITWSGIALHAGVVPNYPASHGCIRLPYDVAQRLFGMTRMGMRVVVAPADTQPHWIEHAGLPQPYLMPVPELTALAQKMGNDAKADGEADRLFNPHEVASRLRIEAAIAVKRTAAAAREALAQAAVKSAEANAAAAELRSRRADLEAAEAEARSNALVADTSGTVDRASAKITSDQRVAEALRHYATAVAEEAEKTPPSFAAARAAREAEVAADDAPDQVKEMTRRLEPLSIFVSLKERSVFIRQGFEAVLESAVDIADVDAPFGTHVFTAMASAEAGRKLRWLGLTMPSGQGDTAQAVLDRITFPDNVRDEIARRAWVGASLVISDHGVSKETGRGTDFVVLMK